MSIDVEAKATPFTSKDRLRLRHIEEDIKMLIEENIEELIEEDIKEIKQMLTKLETKPEEGIRVMDIVMELLIAKIDALTAKVDLVIAQTQPETTEEDL